jgi:diguanylate cyclase (GGDEF)-like protein
MILNKAFCEMVGKTYDECNNKLHPDIWNSSPEEYASDDFVCRKTEKAVIEAGTTLEFDESVEKNGEIIQLKTYKTPLRDYYDNLIGTCGIGRDMTRALVAEHKVSTLLASIPFPILICDTDFGIQKTNSCADRLLSGFGTHIPNYKAWKDLFLCHDTLAKNTDDTVYTYMRGQEITYYSVYEEKIISPSGKHVGWLCFLIDITYERICQNIMNKAVSYDYLTDTKNRRCFYEDLSTYKGRPVCLIYFDLDHFKAVNDTYGHDAGDRVLKDCLAVLKETFGADNVYRIGGDEFTVIASAMDDSELHRRLEDVKDRVRDMDKPGVGLDVSFGISRTEALLDVDTFIRESDQMMYKAKGDRR